MSQSRAGIDLSGGIVRIALVEFSGERPVQISLFASPLPKQWDELVAVCESVTAAVKDSGTVVRIVRPAIVEPTKARTAAWFEAGLAMLNGRDLVTTVEPIGTPGVDRSWLAISAYREQLVDWQDRCPIATTALIPRSIALGKGVLHACDLPEGILRVIVAPAGYSTSVCVIAGSSVIGTARMAPVDMTDASDQSVAAWLSELQMLVRYRLGSDLLSVAGSTDPVWIWAGDQTAFPRINQQNVMKFLPAIPRILTIAKTSETSALTPEWFAALGAGLN